MRAASGFRFECSAGSLSPAAFAVEFDFGVVAAAFQAGAFVVEFDFDFHEFDFRKGGSETRPATDRKAQRQIMQIILQEDVEKLGTRGQVVEVKAGYARNFLLPRKLALEATAGNMKRIEKMRAVVRQEGSRRKGRRPETLRAASGPSRSKLTRKAGENDQLFGSVTNADIAEGAGREGLHYRQEKDRPHRTNQSNRRIRSSAEAPPRSHHQREACSEKRAVAVSGTDTLVCVPTSSVHRTAWSRSLRSRINKSHPFDFFPKAPSTGAFFLGRRMWNHSRNRVRERFSTFQKKSTGTCH